MKIQIGVFFGGRSVEHEVSVISALQAIAALDPDKYEAVPVYLTKDNRMFTGPGFAKIESYRDIPALLKKGFPLAFVREQERVFLVHAQKRRKFLRELHAALPIVHGTLLEDGVLAGLFEFYNLPYVGCDVLSSALGMDKALTKTVLREKGVAVLPCLCFHGKQDLDACADASENAFGYPMIVKPVNSGSSVGIAKAGDRTALLGAMRDALQFSPRILVEKALTNMREINCSVLGDAFGDARTSVCEAPAGDDEILSYADKYVPKGTDKGTSKGMSSARRQIPADLPAETEAAIRRMAEDAFRALGCAGVARVDCMIDNDTGLIYVNELNTIPGSMAFYLWQATNLSYPAMLHELISQAFARHRARGALLTSFESNILATADLGGSKQTKV